MLLLKQEIKSFISTNLAQPRPEWSSTTTYGYQDEVTYKNHVYRSIVNGNVGTNPSLNTGKWLLWEVDNSFASIDLHSLTESTIDDGLTYIEYEFNAYGFTVLALRGVYGLSVDLLQYDGTATLITSENRTGIPERTCSDDWFNYFFCDIQSETDLTPIDMIFTVLDPQTETIKIRVHKRSNGLASLSSMVGGRAFDIGATEFGLTGGFIDYSLRETDKNGITKITKRNIKEIMGASVVMSAPRTQQIKRYVKGCMGEVLMFIADPTVDTKYENLTILGSITDFSIDITNPIKSYGTIEIEEHL